MLEYTVRCWLVSNMERLLDADSKLGLEGKDLLQFISEQQSIEREERQKEREERKWQAEERKLQMQIDADRDKQAAERRHELEMRQLELGAQRGNHSTGFDLAKSPKLPAFVDGKDELDSYLLRFERFATSNGWDESKWASSLSALLTGRALDVYSRLSDTAAKNYNTVKEALLKRYELTEEGYRTRFINFKPEEGESCDQCLVRLKNYFHKWVELSNTQKDFESVCDLIVKQQFIETCPRDVSVYLREKNLKSLDEVAEAADRYLLAHERRLTSPISSTDTKQVFKRERQLPRDSKKNNDTSSIQCYRCKGYGHLSKDCVNRNEGKYNSGVKCYNCGRLGHTVRMCRLPIRLAEKPTVKRVGAVVTKWNKSSSSQEGEISGACVVSPQRATRAEIESCIKDGELLLAGGKKIPLVHTACFQPSGSNMPTVKGKVGNTIVTTLRDTGCSGVVVKKEFVRDDQYTGKFCCMLLVDNTARTVPVAKIHIDTPFLTGEVEAQCLPDAIYDLVVGNVPGARAPDDPDPNWQESCAVVTRAMTKENKQCKPLKVPVNDNFIEVDKTKLVDMQRNDKSLDKYWSFKSPEVKGEREVIFLERGGVLYRQYTHPYINGGVPVKQIMVPKDLRHQVMTVAHDSITGGHMGIKKTTDRVLSNFYWPGIHGDITRFCRSCDICQRTVPKGKVTKVPLQKMPLIDTPFKRVAVDLVGPIQPPSENGYRYILTLVDYATRYPEAVPLKRIGTEDVAEALVDMYSRLGVPEEILHDMGTQFMSECMCEVSRLLGVRRMTTSPYHPICNGLVEKFNGVLKSMLKRLCSEQPKQWPRYINALLFAYREVPQESTGFAPFELMYGRTIRGPMHILRQLWTAESDEAEVRNSYQYVFELRERIEQTMNLAQAELQKSQQRYKHYYDRGAKVRKFKPGQLVLVLLPTDSNKLLMQWKGPFKIDRVIGTNDYKVEVKGSYKTYHANLLKEYVQRDSSDSVKSCCSLPTVSAASTAVIAYEETDSDDAIQSGDLLELNACVPKETIADVKFGENLSPEEEQEARSLVNEYSQLFTDIPGSTNIIQHRIHLTSDEPIRSKPYPVPYSVRESLKEDIQSMLRMGVIRESNSPYASPLVIVRKKDGSNRICIDYRKLNKVTVFDPEPMVTAGDVFQGLAGDKYFTKIDLSKGYWQVPVAEEDIPKTAFVTPDGTYEFLKMPFGMMNSGATFVRGIRKMLKGMNHVDSIIDDILIHTCLWLEHMDALRDLFERMTMASFTARPSKCIIATDKVDYIGHHINEGSVSPLADNIEKVRNAPRPKSKKEVRSFLGLTGFYREYIPNYAAIAVPLTDLTKKDAPTKVVWDEAQETAYRTLIQRITMRPILKLPDHEKPYIVRTDASDVGIAAVLMQEHNGELFPVSFASKKLSDREKAYSTIEKECLAIVWAVKKYIMYLYGTEFVLQTDHQPLMYVDRAKFINDRVMRWAMFLQNYRFRVESIKGSDNHGADFFSRVV